MTSLRVGLNHRTPPGPALENGNVALGNAHEVGRSCVPGHAPDRGADHQANGNDKAHDS